MKCTNWGWDLGLFLDESGRWIERVCAQGGTILSHFLFLKVQTVQGAGKRSHPADRLLSPVVCLSAFYMLGHESLKSYYLCVCACV